MRNASDLLAYFIFRAASLVSIGLLNGLHFLYADELVILSPHWEGIRFEMARDFRSYYHEKTGKDISIRWLDVGGASDIVKYIKSEFASKKDSIEADLVFGGGTDPFIELKRAGFLASFSLPQELLSQIPPELNGVPLYDSQHQWHATALSTFGILSNKEVIRRMNLPEVREWKDLARSELHSWIGAADPRKSGSIHLMYEAILQAYGWEEGWRILFGIGANARNFSNQASQVVKDIASGEVAYGLSIDSYAFEMIRKYGSDSLDFVVPENVSPVTGDAIAILRGAPHVELAQEFILFVLSQRGQKLFYYKKGVPGGPIRYELAKLPVLPNLYSIPKDLESRPDRPFNGFSTFRYDASKAARRWTVVNDLIGAWIIDNRVESSAKDLFSAASAAQYASPESETRVTELAEGNYAAQRSRLIRDWSLASRNRNHSGPSAWISYRAVPVLAFFVFLVAGSVIRLRRRRP